MCLNFQIEFNMTAVIRIVLGPDNAKKLSLPSGIPNSLEDLKTEIASECQIPETIRFRLQYYDTEFNEFFNLSSPSELKDKSTVKVIYINEPATDDAALLDPVFQRQDDVPCVSPSPSSLLDTQILSSPSSLRSQPWPKIFQIPHLAYEVEVELERANTEYRSSGSLFTPGAKLKSNILETLVKEIIKYKVYPTCAEFDAVAEALVTKYPFLKEKGSTCGYYGWKVSLKYKMANYRTKLRSLGVPEMSINSMKGKSTTHKGSHNQVKKPRKAEVNYCPSYPAGETKESLEEERKALLLEVHNKNQQQVKIKMEKTFAYRRQEIVQDMPLITDLKSRWPALFSESEVMLSVFFLHVLYIYFHMASIDRRLANIILSLAFASILCYQC